MKSIKKYLLLFYLLLSVVTGYTNTSSQLAELYIGQYKAIAVSEMHRTGIPASIKLAQGLLESNWGRSDLASEANNHFGIKCGSSWMGQTFHKHDDDYNDKGELVASCFRAYTDSYESYIAHSDFLSDPNKEYRYGFLFSIENKNYRKWANGLLKSGYATDKKYPSKLITIIEQYKLYEFDHVAPDTESPIYANHSEEAPSRTKISTEKNRKKSPTTNDSYAIKHINEAQVVTARGGETVKNLAKSINVSWSKIIRYNENLKTANQKLTTDELVYLSKKPKFAKKGPKVHYVQSEENMYDIAQQYGIDMKSLYRLNKIKKGTTLTEGMEISLKDPVKRKPKTRDIAKTSKTRKTNPQKTNRRKKKANNNHEEYLFGPDWADRNR